MKHILSCVLLGMSLPPLAQAVWPYPQMMNSDTKSTTILETNNFKLEATGAGASSDILLQAFHRYSKLFFAGSIDNTLNDKAECDKLTALQVHVLSSDDTLLDTVSENYTLNVDASCTAPSASITADTVFGALRGFETFSQLIVKAGTGDYTISSVNITDFPRFPFRAVLIDSGRHYLPIPLLQAHLDTMAYNKMNVLHWHIVDMPSFPYVSKKYPDLSEKGAFDSNHVYTPQNISDLIQYARYRGVRIIPEFDTPAHTYPSWGKGGPAELLTTCSSGGFDGVGPLRADRNETYSFLQELFSEVGEAFPDKIFHFGGDEMHPGCWENNPDVAKFLKKKNMTGEDLISYYMRNLFKIGNKLNKSTMLWHPGAADNLPLEDLPEKTIFDVYGAWNYSYLQPLLDAGKSVVRSADLYLDQICNTDPDGTHHGTYWGYFSGWDYYMDIMQGFPKNTPLKLILGAKANMWGEHVDATNFIPRVWPRASCLAEALWSDTSVVEGGWKKAAPRLDDFRCVLTSRNIAAEPIGSLLYGEVNPAHSAGCSHEINFEYTPP
eukprot:m.64664 g.64664  ORF g.64664 m.64664 type:complete len:551 (+) comp11662_c0_seq1:106-1758(+)